MSMDKTAIQNYSTKVATTDLSVWPENRNERVDSNDLLCEGRLSHLEQLNGSAWLHHTQNKRPIFCLESYLFPPLATPTTICGVNMHSISPWRTHLSKPKETLWFFMEVKTFQKTKCFLRQKSSSCSSFGVNSNSLPPRVTPRKPGAQQLKEKSPRLNQPHRKVFYGTPTSRKLRENRLTSNMFWLRNPYRYLVQATPCILEKNVMYPCFPVAVHRGYVRHWQNIIHARESFLRRNEG